jgi:hypothetical protein
LLEIVDACTIGVVLDERSAAAFDHPGASCCRESVEETHRSRSRTPPSSSASSTHVAVAVVIFTATQVSSARAHRDDDHEPLDLDLTIVYRFGILIRSDE